MSKTIVPTTPDTAEAAPYMTLDDACRIEAATGVSVPALIDKDRTVAELERGNWMPSWADSWEFWGDGESIGFDGHFGSVELSSWITFGKNWDDTARGLHLYLPERDEDYTSVEKIDALIADLTAARNAIEATR